MNEKKQNNLISILMYLILITLLLAIIFFCVYVIKDQLLKDESKIISATQEGIREITTKLPEDNEEVKVISIEPVSNTEKNNNESSLVGSNRFYYNQLDYYSKMIYDALNNSKEDLKTGTSRIILPNELANLLTTDEGAAKVETLFSVAINAFEYDNPDIFYLDYSKMVLFYESDFFGNNSAYIEKDSQEENYLIEGFHSKEDIETAEKSINNVKESVLSNISTVSSEYEKIKYIHDWIVKNTKYDETLARPNKNNIYGVLIERQATCGGYALTLKYILNDLGIESIVIQGKGFRDGTSEYHAWNYVNVNGKWYAIDCTWDDPIVEGVQEENKKIYYDYFLKNGKIFDDHARFETFYGTDLKITYPELSANNY